MLSVTAKHLMLSALFLFPHDFLPLFSNNIVDLSSWNTVFSSTGCPWHSTNNGVHSANSSRSSTPHNSDVVELEAFSFCFVDALWTAPVPPLNDIAAPV